MSLNTNLNPSNPNTNLTWELSASPASQWISAKYLSLRRDLDQNLQVWELAHSVDALYRFLWDNFADWYVEYLKTEPAQLPFAKELFRQYLITLSPYMPFETEVLWQEFFGEKTVLALELVDPQFEIRLRQQLDSAKIQEFEKVIEFVTQVRSIRGLFALDAALPLQIYTTEKFLFKYTQLVKLLAKAELIEEERTDLYTSKSSDCNFSLDILKLIKDKNFEVERTNKQILSLEKQISQLTSQLENEKFLAGAEPEIIEEKRQSLAARSEELQQQKDKLTFLAA